MPTTTPARPSRKKKRPTAWPKPTGPSPTSPGPNVPDPRMELVKSGDICKACPSPELGALVVGESCQGPKSVSFGNEDILYCGRGKPKKSRRERILESLKVPIIDE